MAYIYDLTDTWSAGGTVFNAIKMNVTDSASAVTSKLVSLQTNGTEHFSVTKAGAGYFSGNVGIGVAPLANIRLYVRTATVTDTAYYADNGANSGFKVKFASSLTSILNDFGADLVLGANDTECMRIKASGQVGIGTSSPSVPLDVSKNGVNSGLGYSNVSKIVDGAGNKGLVIGYDNSAQTTVLTANSTAASSNMAFWTYEAGGSGWGERMRVSAGGDVGIGTTAALGKLQVASAGAGASEIVASNTVGVERIHLISRNTAGNSYIQSQNSTCLVGTYDNYSMQFLTNNTERMRIDTSGNVGIGVTPSAWGSGFKAIDIGPGSSLANLNSGTETVLSSNSYRTATNWIYKNSQEAGYYRQASGTHTWYNAPSGTAGNAISFTQAMTLDASGNLGIGTATPDIFGRFYTRSVGINSSGTSMIQINGTTYGGIDLGFNGTRVATMLAETGGLFLQTVTAAPMSLGTNGLERMRIDASGQVGIGTTSTLAKLHVAANGTYQQYLTGTDINQQLRLGYDTTNNVGKIQSVQVGVGFKDLALQPEGGNVGIGTVSPSSKLDVNGVITGGNGTIKTVISYLADAGVTGTLSNHAYVFYANNAERMRIDTSGNLLVGTTSVNGLGGTTIAPNYALWNSSNDNTTRLFFQYNSSTIGSVTTTATTTAYNTSSDVRLKDNITDADDAASLIDAIQVRKFDWKADGSHQRYGFVAQELVTVAPEAVSQPADPDDMMGVDYSKLVPMLVKEIQSLRARVAQLEGTA